MPKIKRAISVDEILKTKFIDIPFKGRWERSFGIPEMSGVWVVWGASGNGKTRFLLALGKELATHAKTAYNTLEEGARKSFQKAVKESNMRSVARKFIILNREEIEDLKIRLKQNKRLKIIIIDSLQYTGMTKKEYKALKQDFPDRLFIFVSHSKGREPKGALAEFVRYDADIKIRVEGYKAFPVSRYGGGEEFIIWEKGAMDYWSDF